MNKLSWAGVPKTTWNFFQVREKSGNLSLSQGKLQKVKKSGKSQGISKFSQKGWSLAIYQCLKKRI